MPSLRISVSSLCRSLALLGLCTAAACLKTYGEASTETGNPPVIDPLKVALEVRTDEVHAVGKPHAVTPGGIEIEIRLIGSKTIKRGPVASNGSFDVKVNSAPDAAFEAVAVAGDEVSNAVYLLRDGSTVGDASSNSLSCDQRIELAKREVDLAIQSADTSCTTDSDCTFMGPVLNSCYFSCASAVASTMGMEAINASLDEIDSGLCAQFESDGCGVGVLPCPAPPLAAVCSKGTCIDSAVLSCDQRVEMAKTEINAAAQQADKSCQSDSDCGSMELSMDCYTSCDYVVASQAGLDAVNATFESLDQGVCKDWSSSGCPTAIVSCAVPTSPDAVTCFNGFCVDPSELCVWGVDELLAEVGAEVGTRTACGSPNAGDSQGVADALDCFDLELATGNAAEFTANFCKDCSIPHTYVGLSTGSFFEIILEDDAFGDDLREATVFACDSIELDANQRPSCVNATQLYDCTEPRSIPR